MHRIDGAGATVDNKFTDGDPVAAIQATLVTGDWLNDVQEELMSILTAGGVTPVKGTQNQVYLSLAKLIQSQGMTAFTTAGTSPALTLTPSPAIAAYAAPQRFRVKFSANSTGADTINISGKGPKSLKQYSSTGAKIPAVFANGQLADVEYDGTDAVVKDPLPGSTTSLVARLSSATVQAVSGATITPQVYTPLSSTFTADGSLYSIKVKLNLNIETINAATGPSNAVVAKLLNGATPLDTTSANIAVPSFAGQPFVIEWIGTLSGTVTLTTTFEKTYANGSVTVNGDRDDNTSNISGQISSIEILRIGA